MEFIVDRSRAVLIPVETLPQHIRLELAGKLKLPNDFIYVDYDTKSVSTLLGDVKGVASDEILKSSVRKSILSRYPNLKRVDLLNIWVIENFKPSKIPQKVLKDISANDYPTIEVSKDLIFKEFVKDIKQKRENDDYTRKRNADIAERIGSVAEYETEPFIVEDTIYTLNLSIKDNPSLLEIFDNMVASVDIPYIYLNFNGKEYFKIYKHVTDALGGWLSTKPTREGLHFKLLNVRYEKLSSNKMSQETMYTDCFWDEDGVVEFYLKISGDINQETAKNKILNSFDTERSEYTVVSEAQSGVNGKFVVPDFEFNKAIFTELIFSDDLFSYFMFVDERSKTIMQKKKSYTAYYSPGHSYDKRTSLTLTIFYPIDSEKNLNVRIARAQTQEEGEYTRYIFSKLLSLYNSLTKKVIKEYEVAIPNFKTLAAYKDQKKRRAIKRVGKRIVELQMQKPDVFVAGYSTLCQKKKQPYIVKEIGREEALEQMMRGDLIEWPLDSGTYYACAPREADESDEFLKPGLRENNMANKDEYPLVPCCFEDNQVTEKTNSKWRQYYESGGEYKKKTVVTFDTDIGHIKKPGKPIGTGKNRYGELPLLVSTLFRLDGINTVTYRDQQIPRMLKYGIPNTSHSVIQCLEKAILGKNEITNGRLQEIYQEILSVPDYIVKQLHDLSIGEVSEYLSNPDVYINPNIFIAALEYVYECNIFLFTEDEHNPNGNISLPAHSSVYLNRKIEKDKPTVLILKSEVNYRDYSYRCDLICELVDKKGYIEAVKFNFTSDDPVTKIVDTAFREINKIYELSDTTLIPYE